MSTRQDFSTINVTEGFSVTILSGQSSSEIFAVGRTTPLALIIDEHMSNLTISFEVGITLTSEGVPPDALAPLFDGTGTPTLVTITLPPVAAGEFAAVPIAPALFAGFQLIKIIIESATAPADTVIQLGLRPI